MSLREYICVSGAWAPNPDLGFANLDLQVFPVSLPPFIEELLKRLRQPRRVDPQAGLELTVRGRKRIVEFGRAGEIAHGEAIEPFERARTRFAILDNFDMKFAREHARRV